MGIFQHFPYSNFHEMNQDEILKIVKSLSEEWALFHTDIENDFENLKNYIMSLINDDTIEPAVVEYLNQLKEEGFFDSVIQSLTRTTITANLKGSDFINVSDPSLINGSCYIGNNMIACYFSSPSSDVGTLKIIDCSTYNVLASANLRLYHGNSLAYKDGKIYACGCYVYNDINTLIPDIIVVDVSDINNMSIAETIIPPLPGYSTGILFLWQKTA